MAEVEFGGMTFKGGKMMILLTALSTLGGATWAVRLSSTKTTWI